MIFVVKLEGHSSKEITKKETLEACNYIKKESLAQVFYKKYLFLQNTTWLKLQENFLREIVELLL